VSHYCDDKIGIFEGTAINTQDLEQWDVGITLEDYLQVIRNAVEISGRPTIVLEAGVNVPLSSHGFLGNAIGCCPDRIEVLQLFTRYLKLRGYFFDVRLDCGKEETRLYIRISEEIANDTDSALDYAMDLVLSTIVHSIMFQQFLPLSRVKIDLMRSEPLDEALYKKILQADINYNAPENCFTFKTNELAIPLPSHDPEQFKIAVEKCKELLEDESKPLTKREAVERVFERSAGMLWTVDQIAQVLHTSRRTLQRNLKNEGACYQQVMDDWLKRQALEYMERDNLSVEATATLLGYSDEANFRRAFKRWYGAPPQSYLGKKSKI
tara:strand:+ start:1160 stop:2131 length:972 start_codon:yes stop_codon:yes gene_type:complete